MANYDLTGSLETTFTFSVGDKNFEFRKPTVREMREIAKVFSTIEQSDDPEQQAESSEVAMRELYKFITSIDHDEQFGDIINDQPVGVQVAFNEMIKKELGAQS